jgi:hypothetical protein
VAGTFRIPYIRTYRNFRLIGHTARYNMGLLAEVNGLKEEVWQLTNRVFAHAKFGDHRINLQPTENSAHAGF